MAFTVTARWQINSGGATTGAAGFDPAATMNTTLTATDATSTTPDVSSSAYTFTADDIGHWLFIKSGTNWNPGWYQIISVNESPNYATINAATGEYIVYSTSTTFPTTDTSSTIDGCATVDSPTSGSWAIDYSQSDFSPFNPTDLVIQSTTTRVTSASFPATSNPQVAGNFFRVTSGTGFTVQTVYISGVTGGYYQGDKSFGTASSTGGVAYVGGASNSLGTIASQFLAGNRVYIKEGSYLVTSASSNVSEGCASIGVGTTNSILRVYGHASNNRAGNGVATFTASGISSFTMLTVTGASVIIKNISFNGENLTSGRGFSGTTGNFNRLVNCSFARFTNSALSVTSNVAYLLIGCSFSECSTASVVASSSNVPWLISGCSFQGNSSSNLVFTGTNSSHVVSNCLFYNNTGGSSDLVTFAGRGLLQHCTLNGAGRYSVVNTTSGGVDIMILNCIVSNSGSTALFASGATKSGFTIYSTAFYNNPSTIDASLISNLENCFFLDSSPYVDESTFDFRLNNSASGKRCKAKGYDKSFITYDNVGAIESKPSTVVSTFFS